MKPSILLAASISAAVAQDLPLVDSQSLQDLIDLDQLVSGSQQLQNFAYAYPARNRVFGGQAHNDTVNFLADVLDATGYYDVEIQPFEALYSAGNSSLNVTGLSASGPTTLNSSIFTYTPSGSANAAIVPVSNLGCELSDFPTAVANNIALVARGNCTFAVKAMNAVAANATAVLVYNNVPGELFGTLGGEGNYPPIAGVSQETGQRFIAAIGNGTNLTAQLEINSILENRTTYNVIAETKGGDHNNTLALGGHTDSVEAGPGINDDGSGVIGILNVAIALSNFSVNNAVRFCFWSAEEFGLLGSTEYVRQLNESAEELAKVRAYLNFDMIASPNYAYLIYDGDGSGFNLTGPSGSAEIEKRFEDFYTARNKSFNATAFDGRSDYGPFLAVGIPAGGLFTGAEQIKSAEEEGIFGGERGIAYDPNYHEAGDNIFNLALDAFWLNTQSIADSVATYAISFDSLPAPTSPTKRQARAQKAKRDAYGQTVHHQHACNSHDVPAM